MKTTRRAAGSLIALALVTGAAGCTPSLDADVGAVVRDSAGVRIVESKATLRRPAPWSVESAAPRWSVGVQDGEEPYLLSRVVGALRLPDGTVVVGNGGSNELRFYRDGTWVRSTGREGQGPGEYEYLRALGRCHPGGFVAFDISWQTNAYLNDGTFVSKRIMLAPDGITPYNLACDEHGHRVMLGWGDAVRAGAIGFFTSRAPLLVSDSAGNRLGDLGERLASERIGTRGGSRPHPFGHATVFDLHDDLVYVGDGVRFEVEVHALDGTLVEVLRGPETSREITDSLEAAYIEAQLAAASEERRPAMRASFETWDWPESYPAFTELRVDPAGVVWLKAFAPTGDASEVWSLLDRENGYLGDVEVSAGYDILDIGLDYLLVRATDDLGIQRVLELGLERS